MNKPTKWILITLGFAATFLLVGWAVLPSTGSFEDDLNFATVREQALQFIKYQRTIQLTAAQEAIKKEALSSIRTPCCSDTTADTCCCPCNLSRSTWGMAAFLIAEKGADAKTVHDKALEWIEYVNPKGFSGDVCYTGGCGRPFAANGCGGMNPDRLVI